MLVPKRVIILSVIIGIGTCIVLIYFNVQDPWPMVWGFLAAVLVYLGLKDWKP